MNNTGWIKIYRSLLYWEWADVPEMVALWVRLIIRATHEDSQWHGVTISRGPCPMPPMPKKKKGEKK